MPKLNVDSLKYCRFYWNIIDIYKTEARHPVTGLTIERKLEEFSPRMKFSVIPTMLGIYDETDKEGDWNRKLEKLTLQEFRNLLKYPRNLRHSDVVLNILATVLNLPIVVFINRHPIVYEDLSSTTKLTLADDQIFNVDVSNSIITYFQPGDEVSQWWNPGCQAEKDKR